LYHAFPLVLGRLELIIDEQLSQDRAQYTPTAPTLTRRPPPAQMPPRRGGSAPCAGSSRGSSAPPGTQRRNSASSGGGCSDSWRAGVVPRELHFRHIGRLLMASSLPPVATRLHRVGVHAFARLVYPAGPSERATR
jgi:hypothetical protein